MYTELKELINFLAKFTRNRVPRRRLSVFLEHLANGLLVKHEATWNVDNPISGATERAVRINTASGTTELFTSIASALYLDVQVLLSTFPMNLVVFWNAGEVFYRLGDTPTNLPIWSGDVNADRNYSSMPARLSALEHDLDLGVAGKVVSGRNALSAMNADNEYDYVRVELVPWDQHSDFYWSTDIFSPSSVPRLVFRFTPSHDHTFTTTSFAATRFGSRRPQPDHEALKRIQHAAEHLAISDGSDATRVVTTTNNLPPNKQVVLNGHYVYPSNAALVALMRQPARDVVLPANVGISSSYLVNTNAGTYTIMKQQQNRSIGMVTGASQQLTQPANQYFAMGDGAFLKYMASPRGTVRGGLMTFNGFDDQALRFGRGDGHNAEVAVVDRRSLNQSQTAPAAYLPRSSLANNVGLGVMCGATGSVLPIGGTNDMIHISNINSDHRVLHAGILGGGDGHGTGTAAIQKTVLSQYRGNAIVRAPNAMFSTAGGEFRTLGGDGLICGTVMPTTSQGGAISSMPANNNEPSHSVAQPNTLNCIENEGAYVPDSVGFDEGGQGGTNNAKKWRDLS